jgi:hypothetical protein
MNRISVQLMLLGAVIFTLILGGFPCVEKAFAGPYDGNKCPDATKQNYKSCTGSPQQQYSCNNCKIQALTGNGKVTAGIAQQILTCSKKATCKSPGGIGTCSALGNKIYDLNCDGVVDTKDYAIAVKCTGCCAQPSPFK